MPNSPHVLMRPAQSVAGRAPFFRAARVAAAILTLLYAAACGGGGSDTAGPATVSEVTITRPAESVPAGGSITLTAALRDASGRPVSGAVTWQSSNTNIATVSASGVVVGVTPGQVTITASAGGISTAVTQVIRANRAVTSVTVSPTTATLKIGEIGNLAAVVTQPPAAPTAQLRWQSSNSSVASVSQTGAVTAVSAGNATIVVVAVSPAQSGYVADSLNAAAVITVSPSLPAISNLQVLPASASLNATATTQIAATVTAANATVQPTFNYATSNAAIATVSGTGLVTAVDQGTATITVTAQAPAGIGLAATSLSQAVTIVVTKPSAITNLTVTPTSVGPIATGATQTITPTVTQPTGAALATVTYTSNAPAIAAVNNGVVTAIAPGNAVITVAATAAGTPAFAATTRTILVPVQVASPTLNLLSVTQGTTSTAILDSLTTSGSIRGIRVRANAQAGQPIDIFNTRDDIVANVVSSVSLDSIAIVISDVGGANPVALDTRRGGVAAGAVAVPGNTAEFTVDATAGTATPRVLNGARSMRVIGWYRGNGGAVQSLATNTFPIQLNNIDGFALQLTPPTRTALDGGGRTWTGGSGATGVGTFTAIPVMYTPGRTVTSVTMSFGRCAGTTTKTAAPFRATFGGAGSGADINCGGIIGSTDADDGFRAEDYPMVTASNDALGGAGAGPRVTYVYDPGAGVHPWAGPRPTLWRASTTFVSPPAIRVDYTGAIVPP